MTPRPAGGAFAVRQAAPGRRVWSWWTPLVVTMATVAVLALAFLRPADAGLLILVGALGAAFVALGLGVPAVSVGLLLVAQFFRLPLTGILPADPFLFAFAGVIGATALALARRQAPVRKVGAVEVAMGLYLLWNLGSMVAAHPLPAVVPVLGQEFTVWRFILTGTAIPFVLYVVARWVLATESAVRRMLWVVLGLTAYSAAVSVFAVNGPTALVWPRYILASDTWPGRAIGIFNQPVVNGLVLIIGFVVALVVACQSKGVPRIVAYGIALAAAYGIYLTHTRAVWLAFALVLIAGAIFAVGFRVGFVLTLATACLGIAVTWNTFISADRADGGVGSAGEVEDRLNTIATSFWAIDKEPVFGWGIGRFIAVNTYDHQQWSWDTPWIRGFGIASHFNELGIAAELGIAGLALWITVLLLIAARLYRAFRVLPVTGIGGRPLVFLAGSSFVALVVTGFTVDLRYFDFPNSLVLMLIGLAAGFSERHENPTTIVAPAVPAARQIPRRTTEARSGTSLIGAPS